MVRVAIPLTLAATVLLFGCGEDSEDAGVPNRRPSAETGARAGAPTSVGHTAYGAIEDALRGPGTLLVCAQRTDPGDASGSYERRTFTVATAACPAAGSGAGGAVVVDAYDSTTIRDNSSGVDFDDRLAAWTYLQFVVSVTEDSAPEVVRSVEAAMASLSAQKTYDDRQSRAGGE